MIKQILWDWNGTLLDDLAYGIDVRNRTFPAFGLPAMPSVEEYHRQFTFPIRTYYERAGVTDENFVAVAHAWMNEYVRGFAAVPLHEDARDVLERFHQAGVQQVVLSASKRDNLLKQMARYPGVREYFDDILGLDHIYATSKVAIGQQWMQESGVSPADCVMIGDTLHDAQVAQALACRCVLVAGGHQDDATLAQAGVPVARDIAHAVQMILNEEI